MKISNASFLILSLAASAMATSNGSSQKGYTVTINPQQSVFSSCAEGTLQTKVLTASGKPVANTPLTLTITAPASSDGRKATTITKLARTGKAGNAAFDMSFTDGQKQLLADREVKCSVSVPNSLVRGGRQVVQCPKSLDVCEPCSQDPVICQGDMWYDTMCEALAGGQTEDDCVSDEYDPECERIAGYVKCYGMTGEAWFESYCIARSYYYSVSMCEYVDESEVPDCAKTGEVTCGDGGTYPNQCFCTPNY